MPHSLKHRLLIAAFVVLLTGGLGLGRYFGLLEDAPKRPAEVSQPAVVSPSGEIPSTEQFLAWNEGVLRNAEEAETVRHVLEHGELPSQFITKREAQGLGWVASEGNLGEVAEGRVIGGDRFFNREGRLPDGAGRRYVEADLNYRGGRRGPDRLVFSNDLLIFVTRDHYETFMQVKTTP